MKGKNIGYHVLSCIWATIQFIFFLVFCVMLGAMMFQDNSIDTIVFVIIFSVIFYVGGAFMDIGIRKIQNGNLFERFIIALLCGPFRLGGEIFCIVQMCRMGAEEENFQRGEYKNYFLNRCWYTLFNHDHDQDLISSGTKERIRAADEKRERDRAAAAAREEKRRKEVERLTSEANRCNIKFVAYGCYDLDGKKFFDSKFHNRDFMNENYWDKDKGTGYANRTKNNWGNTIDCFYVKGIYVDGIKLNSICFSNHLNFNLAPGRHIVKVDFKFAKKHSGWHGGDVDYSDYWPSNTPNDKSGVIEKTVTLEVNVQSGYRYHLALFCRNYATYTNYYHKRNGAFLYSLRNDIHFETYFEVMGEADVKRLANTGYIEPGLLLEQVN